MQQPSSYDLESALAGGYPAWTALIDAISQQIGGIEQVWAFASKSTGWGLRLRVDQRVILYMTPGVGQFTAGFVLGEKAVERAELASLPKDLLAAIAAAPRYAEGRGVRVRVTEVSQVAGLATLAIVKNETAAPARRRGSTVDAPP
jgi:hypothetical protein